MSDIVSAVIGGLFSLGAVYLTWLLSRRPPEVGGFADIPSKRTEALPGRWVGSLQQPGYFGGILESDLVMMVAVKRGLVVGSLTVSTEFDAAAHKTAGKVVVDLKIRGGFYTDALVKLDYKNTTIGVLQFGAMILQVNARSTEMIGRLVGYGSYSEEVIQGTLKLAKVD